MIDLKSIDTEKRNPRSINLSKMDTNQIVELINSEDQLVAKAVSKSNDQIVLVIEQVVNCLNNNGRLIYIGAGTSGRIGVLDAVECLPTFGVSNNEVVGIIAGGTKSLLKAQEGVEDDLDLAIEDLQAINFNKHDYLLGVAASGRTPYVMSALKYAKKIGAKTGSLAITSNSLIGKVANQKIEVVVGAEVLTGSTRMKAGTAQKMILNMISTTAMVKLGKVYQNLMIDLKQTNEKLQQRAIDILISATGCKRQEAEDKMFICEGKIKVAIVMIINNLEYEQAVKHLQASNGFID